MEKQKLVLIDGNSVAYRAFYAMHEQLDSFVNHAGLHTNAIYAFKRMFESIITNEQPTHIVVAFDAGKTTFRHEFYKDYKAGRAKTPGEFREQIPYIKELIKHFGVQIVELSGYEADDLIGTLANHASDFEVVIYSGDRDLTQLATDNVTVKVTIKGVTKLEIYTPDYIKEKYTLSPKQIIDMKGLAGDKSDNIPGVTKIGEKTAIKLLTEYQTIENLYDNIDSLKKSKLKDNLIAEESIAKLSKKLATIDCHVPFDFSIDDYKYQGPDTEALQNLYQELNFNQFLSELDIETNPIEYPELSYHLVDEFNSNMSGTQATLIVEILNDNYHKENIIGLSWKVNDEIYVATDIYKLCENQEFIDFIKSSKLIVFDVKKCQVLFRRLNITLSDKIDDLLIGSYLVNTVHPINEVYDVACLYDEILLEQDEVVYGKGKKRQVPTDDILYMYLARKVNALDILMEKVLKDLEDKDQLSLYSDIEMPLANILAKMEIQGIKVDARILQEQGYKLDNQIATLEQEIYQEAGVEFNINSPKQLGEVLFEKMQLPIIKKTKSGYSTSVDVLNKLRDKSEIIDKILDYRKLTKLKSNFIDGLLKQIYTDNKIHTRYQQALTQTGRLSSIDPNLQNIPARLEEGRLIRKAFVASHDDWVIFSSDYSQIELRVLAHISKDHNLQQAFIENQDIHDSTARHIFGLSKDDTVTSEMRRQAKAVNFGVVYGISDYGLSENLNISRKEAHEFIETYLHKYPGVKNYMDEIVREAKDKGYVETLFKRRRYLPEINSRRFNIRSFAERTAINTPIQGSAADILKIAMIKMEDLLKNSDIKANLLLQVHDEVIFEVHQNDVVKLQKLVEEAMSDAVNLDVPLVTDSSYGVSWYDAK